MRRFLIILKKFFVFVLATVMVITKLEQRSGNCQTISERIDGKEISGKVFEMSLSR